MSQDRRNADFRELDDAQVANVRRSDERSIVVAGYSPGGAGLRAKATPGDQKFPYVKDVPDVEGPYRMLPPVQLDGGVPPQVTNPIPGPPFGTTRPNTELLATDPAVDVRGIRLLTLFIAYYPSDNAIVGELILIPQAQILSPPEGSPNLGLGVLPFFPIGVVDPTLTTPGTFPQAYARRSITAAELNLTAGVILNMVADGPCVQTLIFDVATYSAMRVLVGDRTSVLSGLELFYVLER